MTLDVWMHGPPMTYDGFLTSPAPRFVNGSEAALFSDAEHEQVLAQVRALLPRPESRQFTVHVPGFASVDIRFRPLGTAAAAFLQRYEGSDTKPVLHGIAFMFSGKRRSDDEAVITGISRGRDGDGNLYPIPPEIYNRIRGNDARPLLALLLWDTATAKDASMLVAAQAVTNVFLAALPD